MGEKCYQLSFILKMAQGRELTAPPAHTYKAVLCLSVFEIKPWSG